MSKNHFIPAEERRWARRWAVIIILLSSLPYFIAMSLTPEGWHFAGILVNPYDGQSYLAKMRQGFEGKWLFHLTYTPEPHAGAFIFIFYIALGHLAALTNLPLVVMFHLARLLAGFWLLTTAYRFIARVTPDLSERRLAFILLLTASGFGWLGVLFGAFPIDLWIPEAFTPYSLYTNPHFLVGMTLMLVILDRVAWPPEVSFRAGGSPEAGPLRVSGSLAALRPFLGTGLAALALALILPFALVTAMIVSGVYSGWLYGRGRRLPWLQIWHTLAAGLFSAPFVLYTYWISIAHPMLVGWSAQNVTPAPTLLNIILGYGLLIFLAVAGGRQVVRRNRPEAAAGEWLVLWWAATTVVLVYLPVDLQRRFITGLHLPVCMLAAIGLRRGPAAARLPARRRRQITGAVIALGAVGTLFVWGVPLLGLLQSPTESPTTALFLAREEEMRAFAWLRENARPGEVILASPRLGVFIPGQTGARAFYGHPFETVAAEEKKEQAEAFYRGEIETVSPAPDFIVYGPSEQALGEPQNLADYAEVFSSGAVKIYKVQQGD